MFFQNHCRSLRRRRSWEQTRGRKKQIQYPEELERTGNKEGIQRAWSRVTCEVWGQKFIVTLQEKNSTPRRLSETDWREIGSSGDTLRNLKGKNKQLWNIHNFSEDWNKKNYALSWSDRDFSKILSLLQHWWRGAPECPCWQISRHALNTGFKDW